MIGSSENRISYNGNGIAKEFAYNFIIIEKSDIKVLHVAADGTEQLLTKDYYVDMEKSVVLYPGYAPGAEIPESERPPILPIGERLVLYREVPITQDSALDKHWPFNVIEAGLDKLTIICQQIWDRANRSFYVSPATNKDFNSEVPIAPGKTFRVKDDGTGFEVTEDPGKVIDGATALLEQTTEQANIALASSASAQNAASEVKEIYKDGMFTPLSDLLGGLGTKLKRWGAIFANKIFATNLPIVYNSVAEMKADTNLWAGMSPKTLGYYSPNDGGGASYLIREKLETDTDDGGSLHELANGLVAELIIENGTVCPEQFGANGTVEKDTIALRNMFSSCNTEFLVTRTYTLNSVIDVKGHIFGGGTVKTVGDETRINGSLFNVIADVDIDNICFDCACTTPFTLDDKFTSYNVAIASSTSTYIKIHNCKFKNLYNGFISIKNYGQGMNIFNNVFDASNKTNSHMAYCIGVSNINNDFTEINIFSNIFKGYVGADDYNTNACGITMANVTPKHINISNNMFNNLGRYGDDGRSRLCVIDFYYNVSNATITNNKILNCCWDAIRLHGSKNVYVKNNIITMARTGTEWVICVTDTINSESEGSIGTDNIVIDGNIVKTLDNIGTIFVWCTGISGQNVYGSITNLQIINNSVDGDFINYIRFDQSLKSITVKNNIFTQALDGTNSGIVFNAFKQSTEYDLTALIENNRTKVRTKSIELEIASGNVDVKILNNHFYSHITYSIEGSGNDTNVYAIGNFFEGKNGINNIGYAYNNITKGLTIQFINVGSQQNNYHY